MPDVKKIAALAMLEVDVEEAATLCADVAAILDMGKTLPAEEDIPLPPKIFYRPNAPRFSPPVSEPTLAFIASSA